MVFYCECAADFSMEYGYADEPYFNSLVRMFEEALKLQAELPADLQKSLLSRLERVSEISHNFGYGVGDDMDYLIEEYANS